MIETSHQNVVSDKNDFHLKNSSFQKCPSEQNSVLHYPTEAPRKTDPQTFTVPDFIRALCEIALNVLKSNIPLSSSQYNNLIFEESHQAVGR